MRNSLRYKGCSFSVPPDTKYDTSRWSLIDSIEE